MRHRVNIFSKYSKPTVELVLSLLANAYEKEYLLDRCLLEISDEVWKEIEKFLKEANKNGKIDLSRKIDLENNPSIYQALKEIENKQWERLTEYYWIGYQVIKESLIETYQLTIDQTGKIFNPIIQQLDAKAKTSHQYFKLHELNIPKVEITDTYIYNHYIQIPWCQDGKTYSDRLYGHVANFESKLAYVLEEGITNGRGLEWMKQAWQKLTGATSYDTARLLKTETVAMWSQATKKAYLNMGIEYVEIVGDAECGGICLDYVDGAPIPLVDAELGDELPPYHPNCACSYVAWYEEPEEDDEPWD